jgi:hypothetical protein
MAQKQSHSEQTESMFPFNFLPGEFAAMGKKNVENFVTAQTELLNTLQRSNREWLNRVQSEASLTTEFASRLTMARTFPDAMTVCQEWSQRRLELMAEDGKHLLADTQKIMDAGRRMLTNGGWPNGRPSAGT